MFISTPRIAKLIPYYGILLLFGIGSLFYNAFCLCAWMLPGRQSRMPMHRKLNHFFVRVLLRLVRLPWICRLTLQAPPPQRSGKPALIVANHGGLLDALVIHQMFPDMACVFKRSLRYNPLFSHILRCAGHLTNDSGIDLIREAVGILKQGRPVLIFPQGTRKSDHVPIDLKAGFTLIARRAQVPITLIHIQNPTGFLSKDRGFRAPVLPLPYAFVWIGDLNIHPGESPESIAERVRAQFELHRLQA
jgi:1-acyl-sn-glycerol-3-phosphate acyltransferase